MAEYQPEGKATKWSLLAAYNPDSSELSKVEEVYMEDTTKGLLVANYVWDTTTLAWVKATQSLLITDSLYLAVDGVETLLTSIDTDTAAMVVDLAAIEVLLGTIDADTGAIKTATEAAQTALQIMDDWDETDRAKVNLIVGQAGIAAGTGAMGVTVPRVTLATDDPAVVDLAAIEVLLTTIAGGMGGDSTFTVTQSTTTWAVQWSEGTSLLASILADTAAMDTSLASAVTLLGTIDADTGAIKTAVEAIQTAVQIMDDWDTADRCRVSPITGQSGVVGGEGVITALTQRVTIATDDDAVAHLAEIEEVLEDAKNDFFLDSWLVDGTNVYTAKVNKLGVYFITKYDTSGGHVTYNVGAGGVPSQTGWAVLAYNVYDTEF